MNNTFTLVVNAGRSGSSFLSWILLANFKSLHVLHEEIPVNISKPKYFNRAYNTKRVNEILNDKFLCRIFSAWEKKICESSIIETGWTSCHLAPVLYKIFGEKFRIIILHRNPISFALSRANLGSYHPQTFYGTTHDVTPFDQYSIAPEYQTRWSSMNHFEKCMFWWFVVYKEAFEFHKKYPSIPCLCCSSEELFSLHSIKKIVNFLNLNPENLTKVDVSKNEIPLFSRETFPILDSWQKWNQHPEILRFAESLGYGFDPKVIGAEALKYQLPKGIFPWLRYSTGFWRARRRVGKICKNIGQSISLIK